MRMMFWDSFNKFVADDVGDIPLETKPTLSFQFNELRFVYGVPSAEAWRSLPTGKEELTATQMTEIITFIDAKRASVGVTVMAVDAKGKYLGKVLRTDPNFHMQVSTQPPNSDPYRYINGEWVRVYPIDANGYFCNEAQSVDVVLVPPVETEYKVRWSAATREWVDPTVFQTLTDSALLQVLTIALEAIRADIVSFDNQKYLEFVQKIAFDIKNAAGTYPELTTKTTELLARIDRTVEEISVYAKERNDITMALTYLKVGLGTGLPA